MKHVLSLMILALALSSAANAQGKIPNLGEVKIQLKNYKASGAYERDVAAVLSKARKYVEKRASAVQKPAIVLDIDETSLLSWDEMIANDFGFIPDGPCDNLPKGPCGVRAWEKSGRADVIAPTLDLFRAARAKQVTVFFVTGRPDDEREGTEQNLRRVGYTDFQQVLMRPAGNTQPAAVFKPAERAKIAAQGYTIIANIGDQKSDLVGGHAEKTFLVPNPFYMIQ